MSSSARTVAGIALLGLLQLGLWLAYRAVTSSRTEAVDTSYAVPAPTRLDTRLALQTSDGGTRDLGELAAGRPVLLHFWATWCAPCQRELPTLLELASVEHEALPQVVLVALDDDWPIVKAFFKGRVPPGVVRQVGASPASDFGVSTLPDTYLLDGSLAAVARFHGARAWDTAAMQDQLKALLRSAPRSER